MRTGGHGDHWTRRLTRRRWTSPSSDLTAAVAATAFRARISGLLETSWPADVKPLIDDYVTKAAQGLNLLNVAAKAKSIDEIVAAASQDSTDAINAADTLVRVKLGLPTVDNS